MKRQTPERLRDMIEYAEKILRRAPKDRRAFDRDEVLQTALLHWIENLGEAANGVDRDVQRAHPQVPWRQMIAMRNRITHGYFELDMGTVWNVVDREIPRLLPQIRAILGSVESR
ncbi:HepT-like ribonuclease domain-containing protein [Saccharopolyspora shandongensis]|uniref:HepT-like ribonuclease domain-containing protein n=1 Tax=Saccharopolyspora shandongensis TaxID=418495 RepID=UPI0033CC243E